MNHIKTVHEEEAAAKASFANVAVVRENVEADENVEAAARKLHDLMVKADEDELEMSRLRGVIMKSMGNRDILVGKDGTILCKWTNGNATRKVEWKGLCAKYKVSDEDIKIFTTVSTGARRFSMELA